MGHETLGGEDEATRGLRKFGLESIADMKIPGKDTTVRDFLDFCDDGASNGNDARTLLAGLDGMDPTDPTYQLVRTSVRDHIAEHLGIELPEE